MNTFTTVAKSFVKQGSMAIVALAMWASAPAIAFAQEITEIDPQYSNYYGTLTSNQTTHYKYRVPANTFGVFTLKNSRGSSDFDIFVYEYTGDYELIDRGENSGTQTELIVVSPSTEARYIYLAVANAGSQTSEYELYADYVSPVNKMALSVAKTMLFCGGEQDEAASRTAPRVFTTITSMLEGNGLTGIAMDLAIDEITAEMREQLGYGCMGNFAVDWTVSIVSGFYKNYP